MTMAKEFDELAIDGHNYPTWASDIKILRIPWTFAIP
jgi:hypothetical protein